MERGRAGGRVLKGAGVRRNGGEQAIGDWLSDLPAARFEQSENQFARGRFVIGDPVDIAVTSVALVMVDVDEKLSLLNTFAHFAQSLVTGAVGGHNAIKLMVAPRNLQRVLAIQKSELGWKHVFIPADDFLSLVFQGQSQSQLRSDAITIGTDMSGDANGLAF